MRRLSDQKPYARSGTPGLHSTVSPAQRLWHAAKRNFYYRDDLSRAGCLCNQIISRFGATEEADEARLLLHDIRIEIRKMVRTPEKKIAPAATGRGAEQAPRPEPGPGMRMAVATAVVALPIIGIAQDGLIGIAVPELLFLVLAAAVFRINARIISFFSQDSRNRPSFSKPSVTL